MSEFGNLLSYPFLRRGNYQFKVSVYKKNHCLIIGNHVLDVNKFFIRSFSSLDEAAVYIEYLIYKDTHEY